MKRSFINSVSNVKRKRSCYTMASGSMYKLFANVSTEICEPLKGKVKGSIPRWIEGSLYRNGPGMYDVGEERYKHLFDGLAMIQRFHIADGEVTYQRRYLQSEAYQKVTRHRSIVVPEFGTSGVKDPCKNVFQRFLTVFEREKISDNTQVTMVPYGDSLFAASETVFWNQIDPETLDVTKKVNVCKKCDVNLTMAHPHLESDGSLYNIGHSFGKGIYTALIRFPPKQAGETEFPSGEIVSMIRSSYNARFNYLHSFAMTDNYLVFIQQPLTYNVLKLLARKVSNKWTFKDSLQWDPDTKCRFRIVDKRTRQEVNRDITYEADPFFFFHHSNAYEENGHLVLDVVCYKDTALLDAFYMKNLTSENAERTLASVEEGLLKRFVLPLQHTKGADPAANLVTLTSTEATCQQQKNNVLHCNPEVLLQQKFEFPQINYISHNGKKYRYVYGVGILFDTVWKNSITKVDVVDKTHLEWKEENCYLSEPSFIPRPGSDIEDDGVVLTAVNKVLENGSVLPFLLVLDARDLREMARVEFDDVDRFPRDLHGAFTTDPTHKTS